MKAKQAVVVGFVFGVFLSVAVGCGSSTGTGSCSTSNCTGCCSASGTCVGGTADTECGKGGATCSKCSTGTPFCSAGVCKATSGSGGGSGGVGGGSGGVGGGSGGSGGVGGGSGGVGGGSGGVGGGSGGVGGGSGAGGGGVVLACGASAVADHIVFSEVRTQPGNNEGIEIYNPTNASVDLSDYRIYNATFISPDGLSDCRYYNHAILIDGGTCGEAFTDFDIQFPAGSSIGAGQIRVIAINGATSFCAAGNCANAMPDFEIPPTDGGQSATVPDMRGVWHLNQAAGLLTNASEDLILYKWDGVQGSNVQDVDYFIYGNGIRTDKTGVGTYLNDTLVAAQQVFDSGTLLADAGFANSSSYVRGCYNELGETKTGGNGITGHNETSENLGASWFLGTPNFGVKTPGSTP